MRFNPGLLLLLASTAAFVSCSKKTDSQGVAELRKIGIAQVGDFFLYAPLYVAEDDGFFRNEGLDVSIINTGGDDKTWAAVIGGSAEFGVGDPTFVAVSAERGQGGIVVASIVNGVPFWGITFENIPKITEAKQLAPYSVATFPSPSTAYALQKQMFAKAGLKPNIRETAFGAIIPALRAGSADIGLELEPNVSQAVADGAKVVYSLAAEYGEFAITGLTTTETRFQKDPDLVGHVQRALQAALTEIRTDPNRVLLILRKRFPSVPPDIAQKAVARATEANIFPRSVYVTSEAWSKAIELRRELGDLRDPAPYAKFVAQPKQ